MKLIISIIIGLQMVSSAALADVNTEIQACNSVRAIAILAKDNYPHWAANDAQESDVKLCYALLKDAAQNASPSQLQNLKAELHENAEIFFNDKDFSKFIKKNRPAHEQMVLNIPENKSLLPVIKPAFAGKTTLQ
ncbi:MAG: hypothetical protein K2Q26_13870 [Bdellovibrionales bacterium]|nr:hypothetical protein [Bdellovibrionales bacterium]